MAIDASLLDVQNKEQRASMQLHILCHKHRSMQSWQLPRKVSNL